MLFRSAVPQSGTGITFPATQSASSDANTLDDYEEGTFTPAIQFGGGSTGITYAANGQVGSYVKIGKSISTTIWVQLTNKGSSTGTVTIANLPFSSQTGSNAYAGAALSHWGSISTVTFAAVYMAPGSNSLYTSGGNPPAGTNSALTDANFQNGTYFIVSFAYIAA